MKKEIIQKKEKLEKLILNNYTEINIIIYFLLVNHKLDDIIDKLDEKEVILEQSSVVKKGYLTSEEQLLDTLKYIIDCFDNEFWFIKTNRNIIIDCLIHSSKAQELIYSKKYVGDNQHLDYFFGLFQEIMIDNFKKILLYSTIDLQEIFEKNKIKDLDDKKEMNFLRQWLKRGELKNIKFINPTLLFTMVAKIFILNILVSQNMTMTK